LGYSQDHEDHEYPVQLEAEGEMVKYESVSCGLKHSAVVIREGDPKKKKKIYRIYTFGSDENGRLGYQVKRDEEENN